MIYIEYHILDQNTLENKASYNKTFNTIKEFTEFYNLAKQDVSVMNIMKYNPQENVLLKNKYDVMLLSITRENII